MKKIIIFLILIIISTCTLDEKSKEESKRRKDAYIKYMIDCILRNEKTSEVLKNSIRENLDGDVVKYLNPMGKKLPKSDETIIRNCRREMIQFINEEHKKERENILKDQMHNIFNKEEL